MACIKILLGCVIVSLWVGCSLDASQDNAIATVTDTTNFLGSPVFDIKKVYVNPDYSRLVESSVGQVDDADLKKKINKVRLQPTAVWMDRIDAIYGGEQNGGRLGLEDHLLEALRQKGDAAKIRLDLVIYNLPDRDCAAAASNGVLNTDNNGLEIYKRDYIDVISNIINQKRFKNVHVLAIVEPDSLPNMVTNLSVPACAKVAESGVYEQGVQYAIAQLGDIENVSIFLDIAHSAWLGWDANLDATVAYYKSVMDGVPGGLEKVDGFVTNISNSIPTEELFLPDPDTLMDEEPVKAANFYAWNDTFDERHFAEKLYQKFVAAGLSKQISFMIDTSRNGWGGKARPLRSAEKFNSLNEFVDLSRIDRRTLRSHWCNPEGQGLGARPAVFPYGRHSPIAAFVWVKPPGESDGTSDRSQRVADKEGKNYDVMCDPHYESVPGVPTQALPGAPPAGHWFHEQFVMLVENAFPGL